MGQIGQVKGTYGVGPLPGLHAGLISLVGTEVLRVADNLFVPAFGDHTIEQPRGTVSSRFVTNA